MNIRPEILCHPNIPKPLHGLNPRTIKGKDWWDNVRYAAQAEYSYCCAACGVHKSDAKCYMWLEGHEFFDMNFYTGRCEVKEIVPLCHYCHNFIHSGRLRVIKNKTDDEKRDIIDHGLNVLFNARIGFCQPSSYILAIELGLKCNLMPIKETFKDYLKWKDFHLVLDGETYYSKFKNYEEWCNHYNEV
jgi:hypothetical protein